MQFAPSPVRTASPGFSYAEMRGVAARSPLPGGSLGGACKARPLEVFLHLQVKPLVTDGSPGSKESRRELVNSGCQRGISGVGSGAPWQHQLLPRERGRVLLLSPHAAVRVCRQVCVCLPMYSCAYMYMYRYLLTRRVYKQSTYNVHK